MNEKTQTLELAVNPQDFGIAESQAKELTSNLPQILAERAVLEPQYDEVVRMDIEQPETAKKASELRKLIKKNRTQGIEVWHKAAKDYFLKGGQFVDAIKRKEIAVNERMESQLEEIEKHQENLEKQRIAKLKSEREAELSQYCDNVHLFSLGEMSEEAYGQLLSGQKLSYEAKIESERKAEEQRIEAERIKSIKNERHFELISKGYSYSGLESKYVLLNKENADFSNVIYEKELLADDKTWGVFMDESDATIESNVAYDKKIFEENERLKKEAEEKEKELAAERAKAEAEKKAAELKAQKEREEAEKKLAEERAAAAEALRKQQAESDRIAKELQAKKDAEAKAEADRLAAQEAELAKGDAAKIEDLKAELKAIIADKYSFKSAKHKKIYEDVKILLNKTVSHIISKQ
jgi:colicin import membrane protein